MSGMIKRGWSKEAAAMMAGNVSAESDFDPSGATGDQGTAHGLVQWRGDRFNALKAHAAASGRSWKDPEVQMDFLNKEYRQRFGDKSVQATDMSVLGAQGKRYEGYSTNTYGKRMSAAQKYLQGYQEPSAAPAGGGAVAPSEGDASKFPAAETAVGGNAPAAFITHHTSGRGTIAGVQATLRERGLGVQYVMDREGNIVKTGGPGAAHIKTGWGAGAGLSNKNVVGMEIIAKNDADVTPRAGGSLCAVHAGALPEHADFRAWRSQSRPQRS
jgi:Phage tail lysozyme